MYNHQTNDFWTVLLENEWVNKVFYYIKTLITDLSIAFFLADHEIEFRNNTENPEPCKPFKVTFPMPAQKEETQKGKKRKAESEPVIEDAVKPVSAKPKLIAESYVTLNQGPYPQNKPPENPVRFTPVQVRTLTTLHTPFLCPWDTDPILIMMAH